MTVISLTSPCAPVTTEDLPLSVMPLSDWSLTTLTGADTQRYLQGQLTCDVNQLAPHQHTLCAHCDAKGKTWSVLRLFAYQSGMAYLQRRSVSHSQLSELKKYAVFSKVTFEEPSDVQLLGVAGKGARQALTNLFAQLPDEQQPLAFDEQQHTALLLLPQPAERFILIAQASSNLLDTLLAQGAERRDHRQWDALEIAAGQPLLDQETCAQFIPQALNLQALDKAISFSKGCYTGQEMVARAKYRGANKRALFWLAGQATRQPEIGGELELKLGENWRRTGTVLASVLFDDHTLWVQAVLNHDLEADSQLRVYGDESSQLSIHPLPYSLEA